MRGEIHNPGSGSGGNAGNGGGAPRRNRAKDAVIVLALVAAGAWSAWIFLQASGGLGTGWTDGTREWDSIGASEIRYAVWDPPRRIEGELRRAELSEGRSTLSPDGFRLVFAQGERGLNADLWVADVVDGVPGEPRPFDALNTEHDEMAPAFGPEGLVFATDRGGRSFGLDLWLAPFDPDSPTGLGEPRPVGGGVSSAADDTDPLPLPNGELLFASNRPRGARTDFDLYAAVPSLDGDPVVAALGELNSPFDEREPGATDDGRMLVFASDRAGAADFDLYRSLREGLRWLEPRPLEELNSPAAERAPRLSRDGFSLTYARTVPVATPISTEETSEPGESLDTGPAASSSNTPRTAELWTARSRELFRLPAREIGLLDWLILLTLLLLALLAYMAKRWRGMDVLYKCLLVSLLLHLLLMWYLREVYPEGHPFSRGGDDHVFRVQLASNGSASSAADRERAGSVSAERSLEVSTALPGRTEVAVEVAAAAPAARAVERQQHQEAQPGYRGREVSPETPVHEPTVRLEDADAPFERRDGAAPALALAAGPSQAAPAPTDGGAPSRSRTTLPSAESVEASFHSVGRADRQREAVPLPALAAAAPGARPEEGGVEVAIDQPEESFERREGGVPGFSLPAVAAVEAPRREADGPERARAANPTAVSSSQGDEPLPREPGPIASAERPTLNEGAPPTRRFSTEATPRSGEAGRERPEVDLRTVAEAERMPRRATAEAPPRFDATADLTASTPLRPRAPAFADVAPSRFDTERAAEEAPLPRRMEVAAAAPERAPVDDVPERLEHTPYRNRFGAEKEKALAEYGGDELTEQAVAAGLAYLASIQGPDGNWGNARDFDEKYHHVLVGKTGLSLLAFLGAGHTQDSETEHSQVVVRAIDFLLAVQDRRTGHFGDTSSYSHGVATYALAECYAITEDPALRGPLERAVEWIVSKQIRSDDRRIHGGWGYYFPDGRVWNRDRWPRVSVTAWQVMALESARLGGLAVPDRAFADARSFLDHSWDDRLGAFRYSHDSGRLNSAYPTLPASTPAAIFGLSLLGVDPNGRDLAEARSYVLERAPSRYRYTTDDAFVYRAEGNLYFWYYATLSMFRCGGSTWARWNEQMKDTLVDGQEGDGSWEPISIYAEYAGDDDRDRSYTTAMCVLTLEVYYRYFTPLLEVR